MRSGKNTKLNLRNKSSNLDLRKRIGHKNFLIKVHLGKKRFSLKRAPNCIKSDSSKNRIIILGTIPYLNKIVVAIRIV